MSVASGAPRNQWAVQSQSLERGVSKDGRGGHCGRGQVRTRDAWARDSAREKQKATGKNVGVEGQTEQGEPKEAGEKVGRDAVLASGAPPLADCGQRLLEARATRCPLERAARVVSAGGGVWQLPRVPCRMERVEEAAEKVDSSFKKPGGAGEGRESGS